MEISGVRLTCKRETFVWNRLDSRLLRGGWDMRLNPYFQTSVKVNTDKAKRMMFMLKYEGNHNLDGYNRFNTLSPSLTFRLGNHVYLSGQVDYAWNTDNMQYVGTLTASASPARTDPSLSLREANGYPTGSRRKFPSYPFHNGSLSYSASEGRHRC